MIMPCIIAFVIALFVIPIPNFAQSNAAIEQYSIAGNNRNYMPMFVGHFQNNNKWYAEGRYNYEDEKTFSLYISKTFSNKKNLSYSLTPLIGGALGNFNGISAGLNMEGDYKKFLFSFQTQYSFSTDQRQKNFFIIGQNWLTSHCIGCTAVFPFNKHNYTKPKPHWNQDYL